VSLAVDRDALVRRAACAPRIPRYPGATIELDGAGQIIGRWLGTAAPALGPSPDVFDALDLDGGSPDAALVQLLLASAVGSPAEAWSVLAGGAPAMLHRRDGQLLVVTWDAVIEDGAIDRVALFALPVAAPPAELDDPAETNRICVDALAQLDDCQACLRHLEADPRGRAQVHRLFRAMHTLKGSMRGAQLVAIRDLAHEAEAAIQALREHDAPSADALAEIGSAVHELRTAIAAARPRGELDDAMTDLLRECRPALVDLQLSSMRLAGGEPGAAAVAHRAIERIRAAAERAGMAALRGQCAAAAHAVDALAHGAAPEPALIDEISLLDQQLELYAAVYRETVAQDAGPALLAAMSAQVGQAEDAGRARPELTALAASAAIPSLAEALAADDPGAARSALALLSDAPAMFEPSQPLDETALRFDHARRDLRAALDDLAPHVAGADLAPLRAVVERLSHVPLAPLAHRLGAMIRSLAAELHKACDAEIDLGELVAPPATARIIGEILLHAVRNALDHGIERADDRTAAGKGPHGRIEVAAYALGERLVVTVRDDGRGVDIERVRQRAVDRGLLAPDAAAAAGTAELLDLLFHPGFSTATSVTLVSGRGIGMDVIRSLAAEHGGSVVIASTPGRGTELTIELPLAWAPDAAR
jgi:two-component system chemotaxis sensor kinase CheA